MDQSYKPHIDGLRAVAVIMVIFYHSETQILGKNFYQFGYIGVDIFFVISGYLISSIIFKEYKSLKKFSFIGFYQRRFRRLIPALLFMILFFTIPAIFFLLPNELKDFSKSVISNLFFLSNFYFHSVKEEYGASSNIEHPLLHTWSLSLEEQFYILFPLLFLFLFKFYNKIIIYFFSTLLVLSFIYWIFLSQYNYSLAFYSIFTRSW